MLLVKNYVAASKIHGVGLFLAEPVKKDQLIWVFDERVDRRYSKQELAALPDAIREYIKTYGYIEKADGHYYLAADSGKFINHSEAPNLYYSECGTKGYAAVDLEVDDEITTDYSEFDAEWEEYGQAYK